MKPEEIEQEFINCRCEQCMTYPEIVALKKDAGKWSAEDEKFLQEYNKTK